MSKDKNIFDLYYQLNNDGSKSNASEFIAETLGVAPITVHTNWLKYNRLPKRFLNPSEDNSESVNNKLDTITSYLQKAILSQNTK